MTKYFEKEALETILDNGYSLRLHNDDSVSFQTVITALVIVCGHNPQQAEQCATIVHYKGKCTIKSGLSIDDAIAMQRELTSYNLTIDIVQ